jgi:hypothetical protein
MAQSRSGWRSSVTSERVGRGRYRPGMPGHRLRLSARGVLFVVLALGLLGIAAAAASAREWAVAVAALVIGAWMADLALRDLGVRGRA